MRENRPYGSEGGVAMSHPYPYYVLGKIPDSRWRGFRGRRSGVEVRPGWED